MKNEETSGAPPTKKDPRQKNAPTPKRDQKEKQENYFQGFPPLIKKITWPTKKQWYQTFWKISLFILVAGALLFALDWVLIRTIIGFQGFMQPLGSTAIEAIYLLLIFLAGLVSIFGVLLQKGSGEGLSANLGSVVDSGGAIVSINRRVAWGTLIAGLTFVLLTLFAPIFLGGNL